LIRLPYEIGIPDLLFEELVRFELAEIDLMDNHFKKLSLPGEGVLRDSRDAGFLKGDRV
jgi:hypothetical protein